MKYIRQLTKNLNERMKKKKVSSHIDILDDVLFYLSDKVKFAYSHKIYPDLKKKYTYGQIALSIEKLHFDNYIDLKIDDGPGNSKVNPPYWCKINYNGFLFLEKGGYKSENKRYKKTILKTNAKIAINALNAITIVIIAAFGV